MQKLWGKYKRSVRKLCKMYLETVQKKKSIWDGTIFGGTHVEKTTIIRIIEMWMFCNGSKQIEYDTGVNKNTISLILKKMREIMVANYYNNFPKLGGKDIIVEIDESKFGKRKYNRGKHIEGVWILGMVERSNTKRVKLIAVENRSKIFLKNISNRQ